jgi:hypothetical protein
MSCMYCLSLLEAIFANTCHIVATAITTEGTSITRRFHAGNSLSCLTCSVVNTGLLKIVLTLVAGGHNAWMKWTSEFFWRYRTGWLNMCCCDCCDCCDCCFRFRRRCLANDRRCCSPNCFRIHSLCGLGYYF